MEDTRPPLGPLILLRLAQLIGLAWIAGVVLLSCSLIQQDEESGVPWEDYSPDVKTRIDNLAANGNCKALQKEFDTAAKTSDATMARTGTHNNADLMDYIDQAMRDAGCY